MIRLFLSVLIISLPILANADSVKKDSTELGNKEIIIDSQGSHCTLSADGNILDLELKSPCFFLRKESGIVEYFQYEDSNIDAVFMVVGDAISNSTRKLYGLDADVECGSSSRGVIIENGEVSLSTLILTDGVYCKNYGSDEKNYWMFAHEK